MGNHDDYNFMNFGDAIEITNLGIWGQDSGTNKYTFSGAMGHFPDTNYRFTQCGDASVRKERFSDIFIKAKECHEGFKTMQFKIKVITKREQS